MTGTWFAWATSALLAVVSLAMALSFVVHAAALWRDEVSSVNTQLASWNDMWRLSEFESFPALWMLLLRGWLAVSETDAWLRLFGLGMYVVFVIAFAAIAWRITRRPPLLVWALLFFNPETIRWGTTIRPWSLGAALGLGVVWTMWRTFERPSWFRALASALIAVVSVQCTFQNAIVIAAATTSVSIIAVRRRRLMDAAGPAAAAALAALSLLPYSEILHRREAWNGLGAGRVTVVQLIGHAWALLSGGGPASGLGWAAGGVILALAVARVRRTARDSEIEYLTISVIASAVGFVLMYVSLGYPTQSWYYLGWAGIAALAVEAAAHIVWPRNPGAIATAAIVVAIVSAETTSARLTAPQSNADSAARELLAWMGPGDLIVVHPWFMGVTLGRYLPPNVEFMTVPPIADHRVSRYDLLKQAMQTPGAVQPLLNRIEQTLLSGHQVLVAGNLLDVPERATRPPLQPPPRPDTGWNSYPYEQAWDFDVSQYLRAHSLETTSIPVEPGGPLENVLVMRFSGWR